MLFLFISSGPCWQTWTSLQAVYSFVSTFPRHWHDPALDIKVSSSCYRLHSQRYFIRQKKIDVEYKELSRTLKGWCRSSINLTIISFMIARDNDCCYHALDSARYFFTIILRRLVPIGSVRILCSKANWLVVDCLSNQFFKLLSWLLSGKRLLKGPKEKTKNLLSTGSTQSAQSLDRTLKSGNSLARIRLHNTTKADSLPWKFE